MALNSPDEFPFVFFICTVLVSVDLQSADSVEHLGQFPLRDLQRQNCDATDGGTVMPSPTAAEGDRSDEDWMNEALLEGDEPIHKGNVSIFRT